MTCGLTDHCCWLDGQLCPFLEEGTVEGRRYACALQRELGSWEAVYNDSRYLKQVRPFWDAWRPQVDCGDWLLPGETCATCGVTRG